MFYEQTLYSLRPPSETKVLLLLLKLCVRYQLKTLKNEKHELNLFSLEIKGENFFYFFIFSFLAMHVFCFVFRKQVELIFN